jgi:signal transduction histidine kinase
MDDGSLAMALEQLRSLASCVLFGFAALHLVRLKNLRNEMAWDAFKFCSRSYFSRAEKATRACHIFVVCPGALLALVAGVPAAVALDGVSAGVVGTMVAAAVVAPLASFAAMERAKARARAERDKKWREERKREEEERAKGSH